MKLAASGITPLCVGPTLSGQGHGTRAASAHADAADGDGYMRRVADQMVALARAVRARPILVLPGFGTLHWVDLYAAVAVARAAGTEVAFFGTGELGWENTSPLFSFEMTIPRVSGIVRNKQIVYILDNHGQHYV